MSKTYAPYHVVFATKNRKRTITPANKRVLYSYINSILKAQKCLVYRINGMDDHVHLLFNLNPKEALAPLVQKIKQSTSLWMNGNELFPDFKGWGVGYYGFVVGTEQLPNVTEYIRNQEEHHQTTGFMDEVKNLAEEYGVKWYAEDWE